MACSERRTLPTSTVPSLWTAFTEPVYHEVPNFPCVEAWKRALTDAPTVGAQAAVSGSGADSAAAICVTHLRSGSELAKLV